jgi:hypothetical protein
VNLDNAPRTFITSARLATAGQQATLTLSGDMIGGWPEPFGVGWLDLDTIGINIHTDGTTTTAALHSSFELGT